MSKTILVAGGAGYIGSHFCKLAASKGYTPVTVDRLTSPSKRIEAFRRSSVQWGPLEVADIGDIETVLTIIQKHKPVAAVCFASLIDVAESVTNPELYWQNNFYAVMRFFKALEHGKLRHVVFSSSAAVYGNPLEAKPLAEEDALTPINPYGMTKLACEIALQGLSNRCEASDAFIDELSRRALKLDNTYPEFRISFFPCLKSVIFRYFNAAGADSIGAIGEMHEPETHLIPNAILAAQGKPFTLRGTDYPTPDGTCIRDYVHVEDLAQAHIQGLEYLLGGGKSDVFNLGTGKGNSIKEVLGNVKQTTGKDFAVNEGPRRIGDPAYLVANADKAERVLGWKPQLGLNEMIKSASHFYLTNA